MKRCENQGKTAETRCDNKAEQGHIYCTKCRLHSGGYDRYTPNRFAQHSKNLESPRIAFSRGTQYSSNKQE